MSAVTYPDGLMAFDEGPDEKNDGSSPFEPTAENEPEPFKVPFGSVVRIVPPKKTEEKDASDDAQNDLRASWQRATARREWRDNWKGLGEKIRAQAEYFYLCFRTMPARELRPWAIAAVLGLTLAVGIHRLMPHHPTAHAKAPIAAKKSVTKKADGKAAHTALAAKKSPAKATKPLAVATPPRHLAGKVVPHAAKKAHPKAAQKTAAKKT